MTVNEIKARLEEFQEKTRKDWLDSKILEPVFAPIKLLDDEIGIFNFAQDKVLLFNELDSLVEVKPISFHHEPDWTKELLYLSLIHI